MKLFLLSFFILLISLDTTTYNQIAKNIKNKASESTVYVCTGPSSKKYHFTKSCRGLSRCSKDIVKVTLGKAKEMKRTLCGWED